MTQRIKRTAPAGWRIGSPVYDFREKDESFIPAPEDENGIPICPRCGDPVPSELHPGKRVFEYDQETMAKLERGMRDYFRVMRYQLQNNLPLTLRVEEPIHQELWYHLLVPRGVRHLISFEDWVANLVPGAELPVQKMGPGRCVIWMYGQQVASTIPVPIDEFFSGDYLMGRRPEIEDGLCALWQLAVGVAQFPSATDGGC